jgi:hypothetical protein
MLACGRVGYALQYGVGWAGWVHGVLTEQGEVSI